MAAAKGAIELANMSKKYHDARQYLMENPNEWQNERSAPAVRDLMAGNAVNALLMRDRLDYPQGVTPTQLLMGNGNWKTEKLDQIMADNRLGTRVQDADIKQILSHPNRLKSARLSQQIMDVFVDNLGQLEPQAENAAPEMQLNQVRQQANML